MPPSDKKASEPALPPIQATSLVASSIGATPAGSSSVPSGPVTSLPSISYRPLISLTPEQRANLLKASADSLFAGYTLAFLTGAALYKLPGFLPLMIPRICYASASTTMAAANLSVPVQTYTDPEARLLKTASDAFSVAAIAAGGVAAACFALTATKFPVIARALGQVPGIRSVAQKAQVIADTPLVKLVGNTAAGFGGVGALTAFSGILSIAAVQRESTQLIDQIKVELGKEFPHLSTSEIEKIVNAEIPHMHPRDGASRGLAALCGVIGGVLNVKAGLASAKGLSKVADQFSATSGAFYSLGLVGATFPNGNEYDTKRFAQKWNGEYLKQHTTGNMAFGIVALGLLFGLQAYQWSKGRTYSATNEALANAIKNLRNSSISREEVAKMMEKTAQELKASEARRDNTTAQSRWWLGKMDNIVALVAASIAGIMYSSEIESPHDILDRTPVGARGFHSRNNRLSIEQATSAQLRGLPLTAEQQALSYAPRLREAVQTQPGSKGSGAEAGSSRDIASACSHGDNPETSLQYMQYGNPFVDECSVMRR
jgi:hypothetical protein